MLIIRDLDAISGNPEVDATLVTTEIITSKIKKVLGAVDRRMGFYLSKGIYLPCNEAGTHVIPNTNIPLSTYQMHFRENGQGWYSEYATHIIEVGLEENKLPYLAFRLESSANIYNPSSSTHILDIRYPLSNVMGNPNYSSDTRFCHIQYDGDRVDVSARINDLGEPLVLTDARSLVIASTIDTIGDLLNITE